MTLDEAIRDAERAGPPTIEHKEGQIAAWLKELKERRALDLPKPKPLRCKLGFHKPQVRLWRVEDPDDWRMVIVRHCACGAVLSSHYIPPTPWPKIRPR